MMVCVTPREREMWVLLRRYAIRRLFDGPYRCSACGGRWEEGTPEKHFPGCLVGPDVLARREGE